MYIMNISERENIHKHSRIYAIFHSTLTFVFVRDRKQENKNVIFVPRINSR